MHLPILLCLIFGCIPQQTDERSVERFELLHKQLVRQPKAAWKTIPWHDNLVSARAAAVETKKPIFIWSMDGHPLGCT